MKNRKRRPITAPVVRRYASQVEFDLDRSRMTRDGLHVASVGSDPSGALRVVFRPGASEAFVVGSGLPAPSSGRTYELWAFRGKTPVSAGCFAPENGTVIRQLHANHWCAAAQADTPALTNLDARRAPDELLERLHDRC